jgi:hypothetical protein
VLNGEITDSASEKLANTKVTLLDSQLNFISELVTDTNGNYSFSVECGKQQSVRAQKQNTPKRRKNKNRIF